jgi:hypothetical protein
MPEQEKIYQCEVKKLFLRNGEKRWEWREMAVSDALHDEVTHFRCKDCKGAVKLFRQQVEHGAAPHAEHKSRKDSEYCPSGSYFKSNPGREPRLSLKPVE